MNVVLVGGLALLVLVVAVARLVSPEVSRGRLERFARREALRITPENGNAVIVYLAVTRRWRTFGLLVTLAVVMVLTFRQDERIAVGLFPALSGWFGGAVVAEWRLARPQPGERRSASLQPRLLGDYVGRGARVLPAVVAAAALLVALAALVIGGDAAVGRTLAWSAAVLALFVVPALVARYVLTRGRSGELTPSQVAADEAMRRRSLHALIGSSVALLGMPLGSLMAQLGQATGDDGVGAVGVLLSLALLVVGFHLATRRRAGVPAPLPPVGATVA